MPAQQTRRSNPTAEAGNPDAGTRLRITGASTGTNASGGMIVDPNGKDPKRDEAGRPARTKLDLNVVTSTANKRGRPLRDGLIVLARPERFELPTF
jgi:hypothetical protein